MVKDPERQKQLITAALAWHRAGYSVVPAERGSKVCRLKWRQFESRLPSDDQVRKWWFMTGLENMAVVCSSNGLMALDFDQVEEFTAWKGRAGDLASTRTETSGRGLHVFYKVENPINRRFVECEVFGAGHLLNVFPSIHPTGLLYQVCNDLPILETTAAAIFATLTPIQGKGEGKALSKKEFPGAAAGPRDDLITRIKKALPLLDYAESLTRMKPSGGAFYVGKCPLHEDNHPSFWVNSAKGVYGCFTEGCPGNRGGDVINLYSMVNGLSVQEAISELARVLQV